ncbi:DUF423 domain-containing protein [Geomicrobium sp. JCM 19039]|uniref:DUF423 domain-containing protein n=1 Tax=Geomicrobium sp. JCM 19039 TaxID=1460636 RepID=UPI00045F3B2B|nr:DUF423 domain-containing protein [Geomicrobium sp. JCM 19039]GAK12038.1 hypothetical protein JCM19039_1765 [Geomicrobium sp. JCM 19039]
MKHTWIAVGALFAALAVAIGAFGAHGLEGIVSSSMLENYETGVQYHMFHALGIIAVGLFATNQEMNGKLQAAALFMSVGIVIFSGSLYVMALTNMTWLGAITPIGGVSFIAGWVFLLVAALKR